MDYVRLLEICDIQSGGTPARSQREYWNGNIPWVKISDFAGRWLNITEEKISQVGLENSSAKIFPRGTILFTIFATLGEVTVLNIDACTNQAIAGLRVIDKRIVPEYLYYYLRSLKKTVNKIGRGVTQNNINMSILRNLKMPLKTTGFQEDVVKQLDQVDGILMQRKQQLAAMDTLIKARFVEMFGNPVTNERGWTEAMIRDVTSKIGSGATPKGGKESYQTEGITLIRSMNVHDGRFEYKDLAHITDAQAAQLDNVTVEESDVFINITGASVARSCIVPSEVLPARVNQHVAIIRCVRTQLHPVFANNMFLNDRFKGQLLDIGESGGATRQAITKQQLEMLTVILPPIDLQNQFAAFVAHIDKSKAVVQKALDETQLLFDSLMQKYFG